MTSLTKGALVRGGTRSCGCLRRELVTQRNRARGKPAPRRNASALRRTLEAVEIDGVTRSLTDWCTITGVPYLRAWQRLRRGVAPREAVYGKPRPEIVALPDVEGGFAYSAVVRALGNGGALVTIPATVLRGLRATSTWSWSMLIYVTLNGTTFLTRPVPVKPSSARVYLPRRWRDLLGILVGTRVAVTIRPVAIAGEA